MADEKKPTPKPTKEKIPTKKTPCPISREDFLATEPIKIDIGEERKIATPMEFKSGSFGFFVNDKVTLVIDGVAVKFQANIILTAVNSGPPKPEKS